MLVRVAAIRLLPAVLCCAAVLPVSQETGAWGGKEPLYPTPAQALLVRNNVLHAGVSAVVLWLAREAALGVRKDPLPH